MIGLGSQYLTAAGFGRYRITAASLGNLDLLRADWLKYATMQAILGAFGDDGWAVIKATNAYLTGIAASDRDKATALAGFINEDPIKCCEVRLNDYLMIFCTDYSFIAYHKSPFCIYFYLKREKILK